MIVAKQKNNTTETKDNRYISVIVAVCVLLLSILGVCYFYFNSSKNIDAVSIVEVASLDALRAIPESEFKSAIDRLYKVGDDYYSYFPSTGKIELVSTVKDYDKMSLTLLDGMLGDVKSASIDNTDSIATAVDVSDMFNGMLTERAAYVQYELDNCNANLVLTSNDSNLLRYKSKLESELMQLVAYQAVSAEQLEVFLACLGTEEADKALAEKISKILDKQFVSLVNEYNISSGAVGREELEKLLITQTEAIEMLTEKYDTIEKTLVEKRMALDAGTTALSDKDIQNVISNLDVYVDKYLADYSNQVTALETKMSALEQLYSSMSSVDVNSVSAGDNASLLAIKEQYTSLRNEQNALLERINYLEGVIGSAAKTEDTTASDSVSAALQSELDKQKAQYDAISDILNNSGLENLDKLTDEQTKIQETMSKLEDALKAADDLVATEQTEAREELERSLQELIAQTSDNQDELRKQLEDEVYDKLDATNADLTEMLNTLEQKCIDDLTTLKEEIQNDLLEKYTEVTNDIHAINSQIEEMLQVQSEYGTRLDTLENGLSDATDRITWLEEHQYILPKATQSILGGVMVDGDTIDVDADGTLHVLVGYNTLDKFYPVGTMYTDVSGPKKRIAPYCVQLKEVHITSLSAPTTPISKNMVIGQRLAHPAETVRGTPFTSTHSTNYIVTKTQTKHSTQSSSTGTESRRAWNDYTWDYSVTPPKLIDNGSFSRYECKHETSTSNCSSHSNCTITTTMDESKTTTTSTEYYISFESSYGAQYTTSYSQPSPICNEYGVPIGMTEGGPNEYTFPDVYEPVYGDRWSYKATNPFTGVVYTDTAGYIYETASAVPRTHTFSGSRYDIVYVGSNSLNSMQLQKLYNAYIITNKTNEQTYLRQLYNYSQEYLKGLSDYSGDTIYIYCGIPTEPLLTA